MSCNFKCHEMSNVIKCQTSWNVKCHEMSKVMNVKCQMSWNIKSHGMPNVMKCQLSYNINCHTMSIVIQCQMSWNAKSHELLMLMLSLWPRAETPGVSHFGAYHPPPDGHFSTMHCFKPAEWIPYIAIYLSLPSECRYMACRLTSNTFAKSASTNCNPT